MIELLNQIPSPIISVIGFIITILFLVAIHEYGHFWVARKFGVRIEKFSIGFGKPIVKWYGKRDNTEYSISWIPLGGYVKMYGENPEDLAAKPNDQLSDNNKTAPHDISDITDIHNDSSTTGSFAALSPLKRFLIAFAGPAVNLLFAIFALWILFMVGVPAINPYIGSIDKDSPLAYSQIVTGDKIIAIDHTPIETLSDAMANLVDNIGNSETLITAIDNNGIKKHVQIDLSQLPSGSEMAIEKAIGFHWEIAEVGKKQPAIIETVVEGSPAATAGLQANDMILLVDKQHINYWQDFVTSVQNKPEQTVSVQVKRQGQTVTLHMTPARHPQNNQLGYVGVSPKIDPNIYRKFRYNKQFDALTALPMAVKENYLQGRLIIKTLWRLIVGEASIKNMGGPITIADYSGKSLQMGYATYLKFLAAISLTLAVMNLLPIPVLDGGHMTLCVIEMVRGKPLSDKAVGILMRIGLSIMLTFMLIVISVDAWKYLLG